MTSFLYFILGAVCEALLPHRFLPSSLCLIQSAAKARTHTQRRSEEVREMNDNREVCYPRSSLDNGYSWGDNTDVDVIA